MVPRSRSQGQSDTYRVYIIDTQTQIKMQKHTHTHTHTHPSQIHSRKTHWNTNGKYKMSTAYFSRVGRTTKDQNLQICSNAKVILIDNIFPFELVLGLFNTRGFFCRELFKAFLQAFGRGAILTTENLTTTNFIALVSETNISTCVSKRNRI